MRSEKFFGLGVGNLLIVISFDLVDDQFHLGIFFLLQSDSAVGPLVMGFRSKAADKDSILAFVIHPLGQIFHDVFAERGVIECLEVIVGILDIGCFVGDNHDMVI